MWTGYVTRTPPQILASLSKIPQLSIQPKPLSHYLEQSKAKLPVNSTSPRAQIPPSHRNHGIQRKLIPGSPVLLFYERLTTLSRQSPKTSSSASARQTSLSQRIHLLRRIGTRQMHALSMLRLENGRVKSVSVVLATVVYVNQLLPLRLIRPSEDRGRRAWMGHLRMLRLDKV